MSSQQVDTDRQTVLLFGPLCLSLSQSDLITLRATILSSPQHAWVERVLTSLSVQYPFAISEYPELYSSSGKPQFDDLVKWLQTGDLNRDTVQLPNALLAPLVVISQLVHYKAFLESHYATPKQPKIEATVGFCIGLLSAYAVSLSHGSPTEVFEQNAGAALRLAILAGAVVDKQQLQDTRGPSKTLSVAWKRVDAGDKKAELKDILEQFPEVSLY